MIDYSYLSPPSRALRLSLPPQQHYKHINGKHHRYVFSRTVYHPFQNQAIRVLREQLTRKSPNLDYSDQLLLRLTYASEFNLQKVAEHVRGYEQWHMNDLISHSSRAGQAILEYGHVYSYGRDRQYSPLVIVNVPMINLKQYRAEDYLNALATLLKPLEQYMLVGGVIEKWNILLDFDKKKTDLTLQKLAPYFTKIRYAYPYRLKRLLLYQMHSKNAAILPQLNTFINKNDDEVNIQAIDSPQGLRSYFGVEQLQSKYGGGQPNLMQFWPIHTTSHHEQSHLVVESESEYESVANNYEFFEKDHKSCECSECDIY